MGLSAPAQQWPGWVHALNFLGQLHDMSALPNFQNIGAGMMGGKAAPPPSGAPGMPPGGGGYGAPPAAPPPPTPMPMPSPAAGSGAAGLPGDLSGTSSFTPGVPPAGAKGL